MGSYYCRLPADTNKDRKITKCIWNKSLKYNS